VTAVRFGTAHSGTARPGTRLAGMQLAGIHGLAASGPLDQQACRPAAGRFPTSLKAR
jgi:hypothetical protein